jgi:hypothetical protein
LSSGSGASVIFFSTSSPDRVSALSRPGTRPGIRPVVHGYQLEELINPPRFPVAFRLPAFASRSSCSRRGIRPSLRSAYRMSVRTSTGLPRSARVRCDRGGSPLYPEDGGAQPGHVRLHGRHPPLPSGQSLFPAPASHLAGATVTRHQRGFTRLTRPVFPSPVAARVERAALGLSPGLRTPPTKSRTTHAGVGTGHRARARNYALNITSADPPIGSSITACDGTSRDGVRLVWCD